MSRIARLLHHVRWIAIAALIAALPVVIAQPVGATTRHFTACTESNFTGVIAAAVSGDTIVFDLDCPTAHPITLTSTVSISKNLSIDSNGHTVVISGGTTVRLFSVNSTFALTGITLRDGNAGVASGGAIFNSGTLTITQCTFTGNTMSGAATTDGGGAILVNSGTVTVVNSTFTNNSATSANPAGGAILVSGGTVTV